MSHIFICKALLTIIHFLNHTQQIKRVFLIISGPYDEEISLIIDRKASFHSYGPLTDTPIFRWKFSWFDFFPSGYVKYIDISEDKSVTSAGGFTIGKMLQSLMRNFK